MGKAWQPLVKHYRQGYGVGKGTKKSPHHLYMIIVLPEEKKKRPEK